MAGADPAPSRLRVAALSGSGETAFRIEPEAGTRAALAAELGILGIRKLRLAGSLRPEGRDRWQLEATLGATVVQACVVTLDPVTTRIDTAVTRRFVPAHTLDAPEPGGETEMPEDDSLEPLGDVIDLEAILAEALALALPAYPRKDGVDLGEAVFAAEGVAPLRDSDLRPFSGLADLHARLTKDTDPE